MKRAVKLAVAALAATLIAAPTAGADPQSYLDSLDHAVTVNDSEFALGVGRAICADLSNGARPEAAAGFLMGWLDISWDEAAWVVASAVVHLCPSATNYV